MQQKVASSLLLAIARTLENSMKVNPKVRLDNTK